MNRWIDSEEAFWKKVSKGPDCWEWNGKRNYAGYGILTRHGRGIRAHRFSWVLAFGKLKPSACVLHRCDNRACVNPAHLFVGTQADNMADMVAKGRSNLGPRHGSHTQPEKFRRYAKLTAHAIPLIRQRLAAGEPVASVARDHGVSPWTIYDVAEGRTWRHVL